MKVSPLAIPDVLVVEPQLFRDERGFFYEMFNEAAFERECGVRARFVQQNFSQSRKNVLRGLHYQIRQAQAKLVRVAIGEIYDVVVDIRKGSPTYGKWQSVVLSEENRRMLWVPPGFAHGYCATSEVSEIVYKVTHEYSPTHERAIRWDDPKLAIPWPTEAPLLSDKDQKALPFGEAESNFVWSA